MMIQRPQGLLGLREAWDIWRGGGGAKKVTPRREGSGLAELGRAGKRVVS
jgi:hypothetical protein